MSKLISVVVPFYNEEENVALVAERVAAALDSLEGYDYECLFVNDGSTDATREKIESVSAVNPNIRLVQLVKNQGQSAALLAGMRSARGIYILTIDGYLQNDPADFPRIIEMLNDVDCVCGYRKKRNDSAVRRVSSRIANTVRRAVLSDGIRDTGCGTKGFRRECVPHIIPFNGSHRYYAALLRNAGFSIAECPVEHHEREFGVSKYGIGNRLFRGIYDLIGVGWLLRRTVVIEIEEED